MHRDFHGGTRRFRGGGQRFVSSSSGSGSGGGRFHELKRTGSRHEGGYEHRSKKFRVRKEKLRVYSHLYLQGTLSRHSKAVLIGKSGSQVHALQDSLSCVVWVEPERCKLYGEGGCTEGVSCSELHLDKQVVELPNIKISAKRENDVLACIHFILRVVNCKDPKEDKTAEHKVCRCQFGTGEVEGGDGNFTVSGKCFLPEPDGDGLLFKSEESETEVPFFVYVALIPKKYMRFDLIEDETLRAKLRKHCEEDDCWFNVHTPEACYIPGEKVEPLMVWLYCSNNDESVCRDLIGLVRAKLTPNAKPETSPSGRSSGKGSDDERRSSGRERRRD